MLSFLQLTKDDIMRAVELAVMALLGLVVVLFVVRPLVRRILDAGEPRAAAAAPPACRRRRRAIAAPARRRRSPFRPARPPR